MSEVHQELMLSTTGLEAASIAAMHSLGLKPNEFAWFSEANHITLCSHNAYSQTRS